MTPPAIATVDWTALLLRLGTAVAAASDEAVFTLSVAKGSLAGVVEVLMVEESGVAAGPTSRFGAVVVVGTRSDGSKGAFSVPWLSMLVSA